MRWLGYKILQSRVRSLVLRGVVLLNKLLKEITGFIPDFRICAGAGFLDMVVHRKDLKIRFRGPFIL
jgi:hypothetical protein